MTALLRRRTTRSLAACAAAATLLAAGAAPAFADDPPRRRTPVFRPGTSLGTELDRTVSVTGTAHLTDVDLPLDPDEHCDRAVDVLLAVGLGPGNHELTDTQTFHCDAATGQVTVTAAIQDDGTVDVDLHVTVRGEGNVPLDPGAFDELGDPPHADARLTGFASTTYPVHLDCGRNSRSAATYDLTVAVS